MKAKRNSILMAIAWLGLTCLPVSAQWLTASHVLKPGWTAVYLNVDPSGQSLDTLVGNNPNCPIDQIQYWVTLASPAQYVNNPSQQLMGSHWLNYNRTNSGSLNSLQALAPNSAFLIHSTASTNFTWKIQGQPVPPSYLWDNTGLNFIGFSTPASNPPSFQTFLAPSGISQQSIEFDQYVGGEFQLGINPAKIINYYTTLVNRGQAYWVNASNNVINSYYGPFSLKLPNPGGLIYGDSGQQYTFHLYNVTTNVLVITGRLLASEAPGYVVTNITGCPPLLIKGALNTSNLTYFYTPLSLTNSGSGTNSFSWTLQPTGKSGSDVPVTIGVNRSVMTAPGQFYAGILRLTDSLGDAEVNVPVSASSSAAAGLWVGGVSVVSVANYLKTYATNADGTYQSSLTTNWITLTNPVPVLFTNAGVNLSYYTNQVNYQNNVSNWVVTVYNTNVLVYITNAYALSTNTLTTMFNTTNTVVATTATGALTNGQFVMQTQLSTNVSGQWNGGVTNLVIITNLLSGNLTNGARVGITNYQTTTLWVTNLLTTNAPFGAPVTNLLGTNNSVATNVLNTATNTAFTQIVTNIAIVSAGYGVGNWTTNTTNTLSISGTTNLVVVLTNQAAYAITNGLLVTSFNPWVTNYFFSRRVDTYPNTNLWMITNFYNVIGGSNVSSGAVTNLVASGVYSAGSIVSNSLSVTNYVMNQQPAFVVTNVPQVSSVSNYVVAGINTNLNAVPVPMKLRLILFNDGTNSSLLQRVYVGLRNGTNLVLATQEQFLDSIQLASARRISAPELPWTAANVPYAMTTTGGFGPGGSLVSAPIFEAYDDQAGNPFLHTYHPDHSNLDYSRSGTIPTQLPRGSQSYDIQQVISLNFASPGNDFGSLTGSASQLNGTYSEAITLAGLGSASRTFNTQGAFTLVRVSTVSTLTTH